MSGPPTPFEPPPPSAPPDRRWDLGAALRHASRVLLEAGVPSPDVDAAALAAHLLGLTPSETRRRAILGANVPEGYAALVDRRAARVPLQHLTGRAAFRQLDLLVGPGVFVPRPETEVLVELVVDELTRWSAVDDSRRPLVVDLCAGSGAIALAVADEFSGARVWAVELSEEAHAYAARNIAESGSAVTLLLGDATARLSRMAELEGAVDVVACNPPYIPLDAVPRDPEVRDHDPSMALYGGSPDGLAIPRALAARAAGLLRPGGLLAMEHGDAQGESLPALLRADGRWREVWDVADLTGRPRVACARRAGRDGHRRG
ncbi:MAG: peptide chain release factor N(5)-glutamine methyltransferase [Dermatophilaceae bacterium]